MYIRNMTPHAINMIDANGKLYRTIEPCGEVARVGTRTVVTGEIDGIPVTETEFSKVENLPGQQPGVIFVVSSLVAQRCRGREDVFIPNESVRDSEGRIIGCRSLGRIG